MDLSEYAEKIKPLALYPEANEGTIMALCYTSLGLAGEAGEVANQIKKILRDDAGRITSKRRESLVSELGDVAWYLVRLCAELQIDPQQIIDENVKKLYGRKERGTIAGDGDKR